MQSGEKAGGGQPGGNRRVQCCTLQASSGGGLPTAVPPHLPPATRGWEWPAARGIGAPKTRPGWGGACSSSAHQTVQLTATVVRIVGQVLHSVRERNGRGLKWGHPASERHCEAPQKKLLHSPARTPCSRRRGRMWWAPRSWELGIRGSGTPRQGCSGSHTSRLQKHRRMQGSGCVAAQAPSRAPWQHAASSRRQGREAGQLVKQC